MRRLLEIIGWRRAPNDVRATAVMMAAWGVTVIGVAILIARLH